MFKGKYDIIYFIGIGGIGMSALAKSFKQLGLFVLGYDKTRTKLTIELEQSGIPVHYEDSIEKIHDRVLTNKLKTLIVYTPAIPKDHKEYNYLLEQGYTIKKRSEVLGEITADVFTVAVAGTHGKTTTSTMIAHLLSYSGKNVTAFLGGISTNYNSNFIKGDLAGKDPVCIAEADEYDRSFLRLHPDYAVVTAMDADHLDIYGEETAMHRSFIDFIDLVPEKGTRLVNQKLKIEGNRDLIKYGIEKGDVYASNIRISDGAFVFDYHSNEHNIKDLTLYQPGYHNVENAVAAIKVCLDLGVTEKEIVPAISEYLGVKRRFEYIIRTDQLVYVDDYAHHPVEIDAFLGSLRVLYPTKKLTAVFQPHLYSRTRDFVDGFARSLSLADSVFLLDIYPAREEPIPGITSELILNKVNTGFKRMASKETVVDLLNKEELEVLATIGAGDIDTLVEPIKSKLLSA